MTSSIYIAIIIQLSILVLTSEAQTIKEKAATLPTLQSTLAKSTLLSERTPILLTTQAAKMEPAKQAVQQEVIQQTVKMPSIDVKNGKTERAPVTRVGRKMQRNLMQNQTKSNAAKPRIAIGDIVPSNTGLDRCQVPKKRSVHLTCYFATATNSKRVTEYFYYPEKSECYAVKWDKCFPEEEMGFNTYDDCLKACNPEKATIKKQVSTAIVKPN